MLMDLLRATHERAQRSPKAQFDDLRSNQVQLLHGIRISISSNSFCFVHPMNKMQCWFLPQIRLAGCNDFITTFARSEFGFPMKSNAHCRLAGWRVCSRQPMTVRNGRRWRSVTTWRWFKVSLFIFTSPVLPQIRYWPVRKSHSFRVTVFLRPISERTTAKAGSRCVSTNFPKAEKVRTWGSIFVGSSSRPQTGGQTLTKEASIEGRFRFAGKNLTYDR